MNEMPALVQDIVEEHNVHIQQSLMQAVGNNLRLLEEARVDSPRRLRVIHPMNLVAMQSVRYFHPFNPFIAIDAVSFGVRAILTDKHLDVYSAAQQHMQVLFHHAD